METNETNMAKVRQAFEQGLRLTVLSAIQIANTSELRHYVTILIRDGLNIKSEWVKNKEKRFKIYWLEKLEVSK